MTEPTATFEECGRLILRGLAVLGPDYGAIVKSALRDRWIDRADNLGKRSGAFCWSIYGVHPGVAMTIKWIGELKQKTGRTLEEWMKFIKKEGPPAEQARRAWLKEQHRLGTNSAWWLAERSVGKGEEMGDPDAYLGAAEQYVDKMFAVESDI